MKYSKQWLIGLYILATIHFILIMFYKSKDASLNFLTASWVVIPIIGAAFGLHRFRAKVKNKYFIHYRLAGILFCIGIILWSIGSLIWSYLDFKYGKIPDPSIADIPFLMFPPFWILGIFIIYRKISEDPLTDIHRIAPYIILLIANSFLLLLVFHPLKELTNIKNPEAFTLFMLDIIYTTFDGVTVCLFFSLILGPSFSKLEQQMKIAISLSAFGIFILFFTDLIYGVCMKLPEGNISSYYTGNWIDFLYYTALFLLSISVLYIPEKANEKDSGKEIAI